MSRPISRTINDDRETFQLVANVLRRAAMQYEEGPPNTTAADGAVRLRRFVAKLNV